MISTSNSQTPYKKLTRIVKVPIDRIDANLRYFKIEFNICKYDKNNQ